MTAMTIKKQGSFKGSRPPTIKWDNDSIPSVEYFRYLGVVWDSNLTFNKHTDGVRNTVLDMSQKLMRTARRLYSNHPALLKMIYMGAIERYALFGSGAWGPRLSNSKFRERLNSIQRPFVLAITKAYKSVSTLSAQVLAGLLPLDLAATKEYAKFQMRTRDTLVCVASATFDPNDYEVDIDLWHEHPATRISIPYSLQKPCGDEMEIYTDGSGLEGRVGAAFVVLYYGVEIHEERYRLGDLNTVFQAELFAIKKALEWCVQFRKGKYTSIHTDSLSSLLALTNTSHRHFLVNGIKDLYRQAITTQTVKFKWIKAHVGHHGNELADDRAKRATLKEEVDFCLPTPKARFTRRLRDLLLREWQTRWESSEKGRHTFQFINKVCTKVLHGNHYINQVLTGHGRFPHYLARVGLGSSEQCDCGSGVGDALHYLLECDLTRATREKLRFDRGNLGSLLTNSNLPHLEQLAREVGGFVEQLVR
ncbi:Hypothetical protein in type-1 retrotransposable element R1DM, partial [Stegodyphus mimosarum]